MPESLGVCRCVGGADSCGAADIELMRRRMREYTVYFKQKTSVHMHWSQVVPNATLSSSHTRINTFSRFIDRSEPQDHNPSKTCEVVAQDGKHQ